MRSFLLFIFAMQALSASSIAQSLGDVAKQEEARRKAVTSPGKVYTDDTLRAKSAPSPGNSSAPVTAPAEKAPATSAGSTPAAAPKSDESKKDEPKKDEDYWHKRVAAERDALSRSQMFAEALQSRINALTTDFVNRDDPARRDQIAADRQQALGELERVRKEIADQTKAIADTQEEARKSGVPPGWVR